MASNKVSIVIPTYTGAETLLDVLDSIGNQSNLSNIQLIVVIDGPNNKLKRIVEDYRLKSGSRYDSFVVKQLEQNKGRFVARHEGALLASNDNLIFIDDRTELKGNYIDEISALINEDKQAIISNILEKNQPNFVSKTLYFIRKKLYKKWGNDFEPYEITTENFDESPKGTAGLAIGKSIFLDASALFMEEGGIGQNSNDDTRLLKQVVELCPLFRSPKPVLFYLPRSSAKNELVHLYKRGPMFVDYYLRKGSPYFWHIVGLFLTTFILGAVVIFYPLVLLTLAILGILSSLFGSIILTNNTKARFSVMLGLICIPVVFVLGIYVGTVKKIFSR